MKSHANAAIGIRVKRGTAVAIALRNGDAPTFAARAELLLSDPKIPSTLRPYHSRARQPQEVALPMVKRDERLVREAGAESLRVFLAQLRELGVCVSRAAIVSDREPRRISNPHLEAHREERRLFREAIESPARKFDTEPILLTEDEIAKMAPRATGATTVELNAWLAQIGESAGHPWRTEEKTAALAARIALRSLN